LNPVEIIGVCHGSERSRGRRGSGLLHHGSPDAAGAPWAGLFSPGPGWARSKNSAFHRAVDRLLEVAPFLTTLLLVTVYPLLRYLLRDPFPAELFRFAFIAFWIGFLIVNMVRAQRTRQTILQHLDTGWLGRLRSAVAPRPADACSAWTKGGRYASRWGAWPRRRL
jgi:hypothetical protein